MEVADIIIGLKSLAEDRKSFFKDDEYGDVFRHDYDVCIAAIDKINELNDFEHSQLAKLMSQNKSLKIELGNAIDNLYEVAKNPGLGVCVACEYGPEDLKGPHCGNCYYGDFAFSKKILFKKENKVLF